MTEELEELELKNKKLVQIIQEIRNKAENFEIDYKIKYFIDERMEEINE